MPRRLLIFPLAAALVGAPGLARASVPLDPSGGAVIDMAKVEPKPQVRRPKHHHHAPVVNEIWDRVAACESTSDWSIDTGNGFYGGLQFTEETWLAEGGSQFAPYPDEASRIEQIDVAESTLRDQGPNAWPVCGKVAGLTSAD